MPIAASRSTDPRAKLTRDQVAVTAWRLLDRVGLGGFTMRRLADELGVAPMTLYGYFPDKDALLDAVLDVGAERLVVVPPTGSWRDRLRELLRTLHRQLVAHPFIVQLRLRRPILNPGAMRFTETGLSILAQAGFERDAAARAFRPLFIYTFGSVAFSAPSDAAYERREARATLALLDPADFPAVTAAAPALVDTLSGEEQFLYGLDRLLDGLAAAISTPGP